MSPGTLLGITHALNPTMHALNPASNTRIPASYIGPFFLHTLDPWSPVLAVTFAHLVGGLGSRLSRYFEKFLPTNAASDSTKDPAPEVTNNSNVALTNSPRCSDALSVDVPTLSDWHTHYTVFDDNHIIILRQLMHRLSECFRSRALRSQQLKPHHTDLINRVCVLLNQLSLTSPSLSNHISHGIVSKDSVVDFSNSSSTTTGGQGLDHPPLQPRSTMLREMLDCSRQSLSVDPRTTPPGAVVASHDHDNDNERTIDDHPMTAAVTAMGLQCAVREHSPTISIS